MPIASSRSVNKRPTVARIVAAGVEDYVACWVEITVDEPSDRDAEQVVLLCTDFQYRLKRPPGNSS